MSKLALRGSLKRAPSIPFDGSKSQFFSESSDHLAFEEANEYLQGKIDLVAAHRQAIEAQVEWGMPEALVRANGIEEEAAYSHRFDGVRLSRKGLDQVLKRLDQGQTFRTVFDPGGLDLKSLFPVLFPEFATTMPEMDTNVYQWLDSVRHINPANVSGLKSLSLRPFEIQREAIKTAYRKATPFQGFSPRVLFIPQEVSPSRLQTSATQELQANAFHGLHFLDPVADWIDLKNSIDEDGEEVIENPFAFSPEPEQEMTEGQLREMIESLPEFLTLNTQYPSFAYGDGFILHSIREGKRKFQGLTMYCPSFAYYNVRARQVFF